MRRSTDKILTTHTGSLPRPAKVVELLLAEKDKPGASRAALDAAVDDAVADVVQKQIEAGIDIINDGEQGRTDYTVHVLDRLTGFEGKSTPPLGTGEPEFPELAAMLSQFASPFQHRPACSGPVGWKDWPAARGRHRARQGGDAEVRRGGIFHDVAVAGPDRALSEEPLLQDRRGIPVRARRRDGAANTAPSSTPASSCSSTAPTSRCPTRSIPASASPDYRKIIEKNVEALNESVKDLPPDRMRMHVCWGSTLGPAPRRHPDQGDRRHRAEGPAAGGVVSRRQSAPRPRVEGVAGRQAAATARSSFRA